MLDTIEDQMTVIYCFMDDFFVDESFPPSLQG